MVHFGPSAVGNPDVRNFLNSLEIFFCYTRSEFAQEKCIEQCFHTRSESTLLNRKSSIDLTCETLRPGRNLKTLSCIYLQFFSGKLEHQLEKNRTPGQIIFDKS